MKSLINKVVYQYLRLRKRKADQMRYDALTLQKKVFKKILSNGKNTKYGYERFIQDVKDYKSFQESIPINTYEDLEPYIKEMMLGAKKVLTADSVKWFAKSSGTTNSKSKYIPVTKPYLFNNHIKGNWDAVTFIYEQMPDAQIFSRKNLLMGGSIEPYHLNPDKIVGDITGIMIKHIPPIGRPFYTPDFDTALMKNWDEKIEKMAHIVMNEDVHLVAGVPTWSIVLFNRILEITGKKNMLEIWPNAFAYVHGGVNFNPYKQQFEKYFPDPSFKFLQGYNASEGYIALQDVFDRDDMLLLCDNENFFEFIPLEDYHKGQYKAISLEDVELGVNYALVMSNSSGLWRYLIGDTISFTSISPPRIQVTGRTKQYINAFGEELMVHNVENALGKTSLKHRVQIKEYTIAPYFLTAKDKGRHDWYIEYIREPENLEQFTSDLDQELQNENSDYEAKRQKDLALTKLCIHVLPKGTFESWYRSKGKFGSQNKVPRLSNDRTVAEEILKINKPLNSMK